MEIFSGAADDSAGSEFPVERRLVYLSDQALLVLYCLVLLLLRINSAVSNVDDSQVEDLRTNVFEWTWFVPVSALYCHSFGETCR